MDADDRAVIRQWADIAADGFKRDAEMAGQRGNRDRSMRLKHFQDFGMAFAQHAIP
jgi:hypothetical protein